MSRSPEALFRNLHETKLTYKAKVSLIPNYTKVQIVSLSATNILHREYVEKTLQLNLSVKTPVLLPLVFVAFPTSPTFSMIQSSFVSIRQRLIFLSSIFA